MVSVRIDGLLVAVVGAGVLLAVIAAQRQRFNPANPNNVVNQALIGAVGEEAVASGGDYFFAAVDLINPFNESDDYALQVFGLQQPTETGNLVLR